MRMTLPEPVTKVIGQLEEAGYPAFAVGGCVRDQVLGMAPHDYDVCTAASPEEMERIFAGEKTVETGIRHGTLTVIMDGMPLEVTTFRQDGEYIDGRHPETVRFTRRVEDDLSRRDFTINAMAYSPARGLIDPFGGRADCKKGVIRCVGEAEKRFSEDSLRILRALRFSARLGFPIETETAAAIHRGKNGLCRISRERIAAELNGLLLGDHVRDVLTAFGDVWNVALPLAAWREEKDWDIALRRAEETPLVLPLRWAAALMEFCGEEEAKEALKSLKMPGKLIEDVSRLIGLARLEAAEASLPMLEKLMRAGRELTPLWIDLEKADQTVKRPEDRERIEREAREKRAKMDRLLLENACFTLGQLQVKGDDLQALGYQGREIGKTLEKLLLEVVRGRLPNEREALLAAARPNNLPE